jgi:hypothetical protein
MKNLSLLLFSVMAVGCATQRYGFRPVGPVTTAEAGFPASHYAIPPESPRGEVFVTSFGTREIDAGGGARSQLVHVRLAVANHQGETSWTVDPAQQLLMAGAAPQHPDFLEIDGRSGGSTTVDRGQKHVYDLYYRVPPGVPDASALGGFELQWQVNTGAKIVAERTAFMREPLRDYGETGRTQVAVGVGVGIPWWGYGYGPGWWGGFGWYGPWGYPYYGPYVGLGFGGGYYRPYRNYYGGGPRYGGGYGGGYGRGGGGAIRAPVVRGRSGR